MADLLVVLSRPKAAKRLRVLLSDAGYSSRHVDSIPDALHALETGLYDLVIAEVGVTQGGIQLLSEISTRWPDLPTVLAATNSEVDTAALGMRAGAAEFLHEPFHSDEIRYVISKGLATASRRASAPPLPKRSPETTLLGNTDVMRVVRDRMERAADGSATVLIRGESGTGKEVIARAIHAKSQRRDESFIKIDCTSLPDSLLESELFGYERGAFTGAVSRKPGRVEFAHRGTLFFDEIGDVSRAMQAKLLRLLQERTFERLGGKETLHVDVRILLATHCNLEDMARSGALRSDLYYRMKVVELWLPPLRARRDDIELLATDFCSRFAELHRKEGLTLAPDVLRLLRAQRWEGNVRQLENFVERLVVLCDGPTIDVELARREMAEEPRFPTESPVVRPYADNEGARDGGGDHVSVRHGQSDDRAVAERGGEPDRVHAVRDGGLESGSADVGNGDGTGQEAEEPTGKALTSGERDAWSECEGKSSVVPRRALFPETGVSVAPPPSTNSVAPLEEAVRKAERDALSHALERARGNRSLAARLLAVSRATLYNKLKEHGLGE